MFTSLTWSSSLIGVDWVFVLNGLSYLAVLLALRAMTLPRRILPAERADGIDGSVLEGLRYAASNRAIWLPLLMVGLVSASAWNWETLLVLHTTRTFDGGSTLFTVMFAILSIGTVVGAMANAGRRDVGERTLVTSGAVGVAMLAMAVVPGLPLALALLAAAGVSVAMFNTASNALLQRTSRGEFHGRVMAAFSALFVGSKGLGGALGTIAGTWGPRAGLAVGACGCFGAMATGRLLGTTRQVQEVVT
jgi:predicted MFS family arabinose efflux permease